MLSGPNLHVCSQKMWQKIWYFMPLYVTFSKKKKALINAKNQYSLNNTAKCFITLNFGNNSGRKGTEGIAR